MEIVYNWIISQMDEVPQEGSLLDVIITVHWRRSATTEVNGKTYIVEDTGAMSCITPSSTDFTAYPDITFEQVCGWLDAGLDAPILDAQLSTQLDNLINPLVISLPLPWVLSPI